MGKNFSRKNILILAFRLKEIQKPEFVQKCYQKSLVIMIKPQGSGTRWQVFFSVCIIMTTVCFFYMRLINEEIKGKHDSYLLTPIFSVSDYLSKFYKHTALVSPTSYDGKYYLAQIFNL